MKKGAEVQRPKAKVRAKKKGEGRGAWVQGMSKVRSGQEPIAAFQLCTLHSLARYPRVSKMPGMYSMKDLLKLIADQGAVELRLEPDRPPRMLLHGKVRVLDGPLVTSDQIHELFRSVATDEQRRELELCGNTRFRYTAEHSAQFTVRADIHGDSLSMSLRNMQS